MGVKQSLKSLSFLWMGSVIGSGSTFLIYLILAREIGPAQYGLFSSALAIVMILSLIAGFGIPQVWLKFFGQEGWHALRWVKPSLHFVGLSLILITAIVVSLSYFQKNDPLTAKLLLLLLFFVFGYISVRLISSKLQLEERYTLLSFWQLFPNFSRLLIVAACFYLFKIQLTIIEVGLIYAVVGVSLAIVAFWQLYKLLHGQIQLKGHVKPLELNSKIPRIKHVMSEAWPFGFAGIFAFIYIQSDIIMVKYLTGDSEAGYYNVAFTIIFAAMTIPTVLFSKFLSPKYHRWANHDKVRFYNTFKKGNRMMIISGLCILLVVLGLSQLVIPLLFGKEYDPSIKLTNILVFSIPFTFLSYSYGATLLTSEHMKLKVRLMGMVAIFNIVLNIYSAQLHPSIELMNTHWCAHDARVNLPFE